MVSYVYKNVYKETISFTLCTWIGDIDLTSPLVKPSTPVCQLIVTNIHDFYKGTVTYKDLDDFKHGHIPLEMLNKLIEVALQGGEEYDGDRIDWKTVFNNDDCQMTLLGYLNNALPIQVGTFHLGRVSDSEKLQVWSDWMETTASQFKEQKETQNALTLRNHNLQQNFAKMEAVAEDLVLQKTAADLALIGKFKELLNEKKRKIRQLELKNKGKDLQRGLIAEKTASSSHVPSPPSAAAVPTTTPTTATKRKRSNSIEQQVSLLSTSNGSNQESALIQPPPMNDRTSPHIASQMVPPKSSSKSTRQGHSHSPSLSDDDYFNDDGIGKDPLLTTTRSRYRKHTKPETPVQVESDPGSDTTEGAGDSD
ncbi:hypothetical protein BCR42DRAFT_409045 [Absidia repens]|uniref:Uncharacterized protein n=1 Tax=Absidia repens TaxID=90262 RepID=A0A1X2IQM8_9FUNG|nr:hypothetical protein BCR42DRAFT_409045 [Absidia repens]